MVWVSGDWLARANMIDGKVGAILIGNAQLSSHRPMIMSSAGRALRIGFDWMMTTWPTYIPKFTGLCVGLAENRLLTVAWSSLRLVMQDLDELSALAARSVIRTGQRSGQLDISVVR